MMGKQDDNCSHQQPKLYPNCDCSVWLRNCEEEVLKPITGKILGIIPKWLNGSLIRNGPGRLKFGNDEYQHLFDGSSLLQCFNIRDGNVTYQNRFLQSDIYLKNLQANRIVMNEFGTISVADPCNTIFNRIATIFQPYKNSSDNSMISVYPFADDLFAFGEGPVIHKVNKETLEVDKKVNLYESLGVVNHTSHPHVERDGSIYNLGMALDGGWLAHKIVCFPKGEHSSDMFEKAHVVASVPVRWTLNPSYMHTFGITANYFILVQQPLSISLTSVAMCKLMNKPMIQSLQWYENETTQIDLICRKTGKSVKTYHAEAFFFLHIINQYEKENYIVLDICTYDSADMIDCMYLDALKNMQENPNYADLFRSKPKRFILPLDIGETDKTLLFPNTEANAKILTDGTIYLEPAILCDLGCETPRINYEYYLGKEYKYFYAISADVDADNPGTVIKVNVTTKKCITWCEDNCYPSEPIFVPNPDSNEEDDGIIICSMIWGRDVTNHVGLLVLDSKTFKEIGRAEFISPGPVPKCLHGWFTQQRM